MPDTTPQNLKMIRDYVEIRSQFNPARLRGVDRMLVDALAMIDERDAKLKQKAFAEQLYPVKDLAAENGHRALLYWIHGPNVDAVRTGLWSDSAGEWVGIGNIRWKTQPTHWREIPEVFPK